MHLITLSNGTQFQAAPGERLVDAAQRQHITLSHSCRTGRCSSCRSGVVSGHSVAVADEIGLSAQERAEGQILTCIRTATSDMTLTMADLGALDLPVPKTVPCRIQTLERLAEDVLRITLRTPPQGGFRYHAGQYIDVIGPNGLRRSYSLASAPTDSGLLELHVRRVAQGAMSTHWFEQARVNDLLRLHGPLGTFVLPALADHDLVLLATGTGMAPVRAMLQALDRLAPAELPRSVRLYWGGRVPGDLYLDPLEGLQLPNLRFIPVLSRADGAWQGARGHVQQALLADDIDAANTLVMACGSEAMIHSAHQLLLAAGLPSNQFRSDAFVQSGQA